jgi:hypothetical protein
MDALRALYRRRTACCQPGSRDCNPSKYVRDAPGCAEAVREIVTWAVVLNPSDAYCLTWWTCSVAVTSPTCTVPISPPSA